MSESSRMTLQRAGSRPRIIASITSIPTSPLRPWNRNFFPPIVPSSDS
jgi:hypothetical protein